MALSSALSSALQWRLMKTSTAWQNQAQKAISQQVNAVWGTAPQRQDTRNSLSPTNVNPIQPVADNGLSTVDNTSANPTTGAWTNPAAWWSTPPPVQSTDLTNYLANLGVSPTDQGQYAQISTDAQKNAQAQWDFSYADYYRTLSDSSGRTAAQKNLIDLQNQWANIQSGVDLQDNEYSMGDSAMLDQARQNEFRARPMRQQLALNIARQGVAQNAINLANTDISTQMGYKQKEFENKSSAIKSQLEALKGKVPDYMIKFAEANLATQLQKAQSAYAEQLKTGDVNSTDPVIQKVGVQNAVNAIYEKYGTMIGRSPQQITSEIQALMKAWVPFQQAMKDNLLDPLQKKNWYGEFTTAMQNKAVGIDNTPKIIGTDDWGKNVYGISDGKGGFTPIDSVTGSPISNTVNVGNSNVSSNVVDFIKWKEWFRQQAYLDSAWVPTIWYWFTKINGVPVKMGDTMDRATADQEFTKQVAWYQTWSNYIDPSKLSEGQKTALTSFEYNLGKGIWEKNAMPILKYIESGDIAWAQKYMKQYVNAGGKFVQGLANRRNSEAELLGQKQTSNSQWSLEGLTNPFGAFTGKGGPVTNAPITVQPEWQKNQFSDTQIGAITNFINNQKNTSLPGLRATVQSAGYKSLNDFQDAVNRYQQNPELTSIDKTYADNVLNWVIKYNPTKDPHGIIADKVSEAASAKWVDWNPNDMTNMNKTKLQFTIWKSGQAISAAATAMDHMNDYKILLANNGNTQIPAANAAWNRLKSAFGMPGPVQLNVLANTVGDELAKAYNINAQGGKDKKAEDFAANLSPDQWAGWVETQIQLMSQMLKNMNETQYKPIMGTDNPQIKAILDRMGGGSHESSGTGTTANYSKYE